MQLLSQIKNYSLASLNPTPHALVNATRFLKKFEGFFQNGLLPLKLQLSAEPLRIGNSTFDLTSSVVLPKHRIEEF